MSISRHATLNADSLDDVDVIMTTCTVQRCPAIHWIFHVKLSTDHTHQRLTQTQSTTTAAQLQL